MADLPRRHRKMPFRGGKHASASLGKSKLGRPSKKAARQGDKPANEGVYTDVNDRNLQVQSTQQAISLPKGREIAVAGFFDGLSHSGQPAVALLLFCTLRLHLPCLLQHPVHIHPVALGRVGHTHGCVGDTEYQYVVYSFPSLLREHFQQNSAVSNRWRFASYSDNGKATI